MASLLVNFTSEPNQRESFGSTLSNILADLRHQEEDNNYLRES